MVDLKAENERIRTKIQPRKQERLEKLGEGLANLILGELRSGDSRRQTIVVASLAVGSLAGALVGVALVAKAKRRHSSLETQPQEEESPND